MKRRSALYLIIALALSLAPIAAFAAPPSLELGAAGVNLANLQPAAPERPSSLACASLDNPKIRPLMSGMYETSLLIACGRQNELGSAPIASPQSAGAPELGTDVLVNTPALDASGTTHTQSETTLARNETTGTLCSAYNDSYSGVTQGTGYVGFSRSTDDGATFTDNGVVPPAGGGQSRGDPSLVWRKSDGLFYITSLHTYGLGLWKSTTDCASMTWVGMAHSGAHDDKELMAVDNNAASPYYGRLYIAWIDFTDSRIRSIYSTDGGTTWSAPVILSAAGVNVQGAWPTVGPDGDVYVAWVRWNPYPNGPINIEIVRSTNGGTTFAPVTNPLTGGINPQASGPTATCARPALNGNIRYLPSPQIAVTPNGDLHVVYVRDPDGLNTGDVINVYYRRSTDNGATWEAEVLLNDDGTTQDQFFPTISAGPTGRVVSTWYDRRLDANNLLFDTYMRISHDGGVTWQPSQRVSDVSSPVYIDPSLATCYHGDYDQQIQDAGYGYIGWSDDRNVQSGHQDPDVWFDKETFPSDFTLNVTPDTSSVCAPADAAYNVDIGSILGYTDPVTLSATGNPAGTTTTFLPNPVTPAGSSTLTIGNTGAAAAGSYAMNVTGTSGALTHQKGVVLNLFSGIPGTPSLTAPVDGGMGQAPTPTFTWSTVAGAARYDIQLASDPGFGTIVASATGLTVASYTPASSLVGDTVYYWRVRANNVCGVGSWAATSAFRTDPLVCYTYISTDVPKAILDNTTIDSIVTIPDAFTITDVNVYLDQLTHTFDGDLLISILHPDTTAVVLSNHRGGSSDDFLNTVFDQEAATAIASGVAPFTGSFIPDGNLASLYGKASAGTWTLRVADQASADTGALRAWRLNVCGTTPATSADYSDLASGYGVAWHTGSGALRLGPGWAADTSFAAGGDDATDDGVAFITDLQPGQPATVRVNVQGTPLNGRWLRLWLDWDDNGVFDSTEKAYDGAVDAGNNDLAVAVPSGQESAAQYRVRLYDSAAAPDAIDAGSCDGAAGGEVEDGTSPLLLAVTLASFTAESGAGHVLVAWDTLSEVDTAGFNLYRSLSEGGERTLLAAVPAQGPGSPAGASYTYQDANVSSSQAYWYWLEHVSLGGATSLAGSVSVIYQAPTAVRLSGIDASPAAPLAQSGALPVALASLAALVSAVGLRRRR